MSLSIWFHNVSYFFNSSFLVKYEINIFFQYHRKKKTEERLWKWFKLTHGESWIWQFILYNQYPHISRFRHVVELDNRQKADIKDVNIFWMAHDQASSLRQIWGGPFEGRKGAVYENKVGVGAQPWGLCRWRLLVPYFYYQNNPYAFK